MTLADASLPHPDALETPRAPGDDPALSGLRALLDSIAAPTLLTDGALAGAVPEGAVPVLMDDDLDPATCAHLAAHLDRGGRAVIATAPTSASTLAAPDPTDPLVLDSHVVARGWARWTAPASKPTTSWLFRPARVAPSPSSTTDRW